MTAKNQLPQINNRKQVAKSRLFAIEQIDLKFGNGVERVYERMQGSARGAVMVVPLIDNDTIILVKEYCAGTHSYELGFPKGLIDPGETAIIAANRELKEEVGFGASKLEHLQKVAMAPTFFSGSMDIFIGHDLYTEKLIGDEPEPLEVIHWPLKDYTSLLARSDFNEARSIAALMLTIDLLRQK
jgi:ADP-ribose diphosphatase